MYDNGGYFRLPRLFLIILVLLPIEWIHFDLNRKLFRIWNELRNLFTWICFLWSPYYASIYVDVTYQCSCCFLLLFFVFFSSYAVFTRKIFCVGYQLCRSTLRCFSSPPLIAIQLLLETLLRSLRFLNYGVWLNFGSSENIFWLQRIHFLKTFSN